MIDRRQSRILAMQALCQIESLGEEFLAQLDEFLADGEHPGGVQDYARELVRDAWTHRDDVDARLASVAEHWSTRRMAMVDRNILRVAACEIMNRPELPPVVAINEAVEIAKQFSGADAPAFINGILDAVRKSNVTANATAEPHNPLTAAINEDPQANSGAVAGE